MYCANCGKEINDGAVICVSCGCPINLPPRAGAECTKRTTNGLAIAGFVISLISSLGAFISAFINSIQYVGVNFLLLCLISLPVGFVLSIIGTVKSKKYNSGKGFGIAGIVISSVFMLGMIIRYLLAVFFAVFLIFFALII